MCLLYSAGRLVLVIYYSKNMCVLLGFIGFIIRFYFYCIYSLSPVHVTVWASLPDLNKSDCPVLRCSRSWYLPRLESQHDYTYFQDSVELLFCDEANS